MANLKANYAAISGICGRVVDHLAQLGPGQAVEMDLIAQRLTMDIIGCFGFAHVRAAPGFGWLGSGGGVEGGGGNWQGRGCVVQMGALRAAGLGRLGGLHGCLAGEGAASWAGRHRTRLPARQGLRAVAPFAGAARSAHFAAAHMMGSAARNSAQQPQQQQRPLLSAVPRSSGGFGLLEHGLNVHLVNPLPPAVGALAPLHRTLAAPISSHRRHQQPGWASWARCRQAWRRCR
jgi:hypothetical protein